MTRDARCMAYLGEGPSLVGKDVIGGVVVLEHRHHGHPERAYAHAHDVQHAHVLRRSDEGHRIEQVVQVVEEK